MPDQLTLVFQHPHRHTRDEFIVGSANRAALDVLERWPDWPSRVMVLIGPAGSGKSHLAQILTSEHGGLVTTAATLDWHQITGAPYRLLIVEDAGPGIDEAGLFHLINAITSAGGSLLLTARMMPADWGLRLPDLISRLRAATPVIIGAPDDRLIEDVIAKQFADRQTIVDPQVIRYMVQRMERSFPAALDLVTRLDTAALARKSAVTRALVAEFLSRSDQPNLPGFDDMSLAEKPS